MELLPITFNTHNRTKCACYCLEHLVKNLKYNGKNDIFIYICDDRSIIGHLDALEAVLNKLKFNNYKIFTADDKCWGYGYVLNKALDEAYKLNDVVLTTEDDRLLEHEFDITYLVDFLKKHSPEYIGIKVSSDDGMWNKCICDPNLPKYLRQIQGKNPYYKFTYNLQSMLRHRCIFSKIRFNENCMPPKVEHPACNAYNALTDFGTANELKVLQCLYDGKCVFSHVGDSLLNHPRCKTPEHLKQIFEDAPLYINSLAIVLNICDSDIDRIKIAIQSIKHFNPELKIFGIQVQTIADSTYRQLQQLDITIIDCRQLFDQTFYVFNQLNCNDCIQPGRKRKYPKYTFGKFLIPYIDELKKFKRVLYIDNDCAIVKKLQRLMDVNICNGIMTLFDGQTNQQGKDKYTFQELLKYDKYKILNNYYCNGVIIFDNKSIDLDEYKEFISRANDIQFDFFKDNSLFLADQDIMNLCCKFNASTQKCVGTYQLSSEDLIWHYYPIKRLDDFSQQYIISLVSAHIDNTYIDMLKLQYNYNELPFFCAGGNNFGDNCGSVVLTALSTSCPQLKKTQFKKRLVFIGSILNTIEKFGFSLQQDDIVYGAGCMYENGNIQQLGKNVDVRLVRGPLTRNELIKNGITCNEVYGDPSIFIPFAFNIKKNKAKYKHGLALHRRDYKQNINNILDLARNLEVKIINVEDAPNVVCNNIAECEHIFSSALYPIIVAEALGVSATWIDVSNNVEGNGFKFYDYYLGSKRMLKDIVHLDWRLKSNIDFNNTVCIKPPIYNISAMLAVFPYTLKQGIEATIKQYFMKNNVMIN